MSVPLDRLYNFLHDLCDQDIIIYRWFPHGSRKLEDLGRLEYEMDWLHRRTTPYMICHDQEPLNYQQYSQTELSQEIHARWGDAHMTDPDIANWLLSRGLRALTPGIVGVCDKTLLLHSELNSKELDKFQQDGFLGVYYWSHAVIARDWYRYAEHDLEQKFDPRNMKYNFLVYNRAWAGTREYRLKFAELLVDTGVANQCLMGFNALDGKDYRQHSFQNPLLAIQRQDLEQHFFENNSSSSSSADYNNSDYNQCGIEVVLETLFDDQRLHLTEKALRPIACGKPFILAATPGSLKYLRSYGFETFDGIIDEQYDNIEDSHQRLLAIVDEMKRIANLPEQEKLQVWRRLYAVAARNKQRFFSHRWISYIVSEYQNNLKDALRQVGYTLDNFHEFKTLCQTRGMGVNNCSEEDRRKLEEFVIFNSYL